MGCWVLNDLIILNYNICEYIYVYSAVVLIAMQLCYRGYHNNGEVTIIVAVRFHIVLLIFLIHEKLM